MTPIPLPIRSPLLSLSACAAIANERVSDLILRVESGDLAFAWDISTSKAAHRCVRVHAASLAAYLGEKVAPIAETPSAIQALVATIFPALSVHRLLDKELRMDHVCRSLGCGHAHVYRLGRAGEIEIIKAGRLGTGNSARLSRASCEAFLIRRRIS